MLVWVGNFIHRLYVVYPAQNSALRSGLYAFKCRCSHCAKLVALVKGYWVLLPGDGEVIELVDHFDACVPTHESGWDMADELARTVRDQALHIFNSAMAEAEATRPAHAGDDDSGSSDSDMSG